MRESVPIDRISTFFDGIARTRGLRAALVFGGGEQSASLDPIFEREKGVAVMRVRLCPALTISLPPSMSSSHCRHQVDEIEKTDPKVALPLLAGALRRISRLHSILLVIEDLHTMDDAMRGEFALFLTSLADETLSILCFSRRDDPSIRCMIERYLLDEIMLESSDCENQPAARNGGATRLRLSVSGLSSRKAAAPANLQGLSGIAWYRAAVESLDSTLAPSHRATSELDVPGAVGRLRGAVLTAPEISADPETGSTERFPVAAAGVKDESRNGGKRRISVVGEFAVHHPDGTTSPIRGQRLRTILGVLIIDRMLARPLSPREFCRLSAGDVDDPVRAQKNMNMGIKRLEEVLGEESILRVGATPQLNLDVVSVDLLQAHQLLRDVQEASRKGPLMRAADQLVAVLDIVQGEELFPGLEGGMYSAAREEFTDTLRSSISDVVRLLREEGEPGGVQQLVDLFHEVVGEKIGT